jgi:hypothetical protein
VIRRVSRNNKEHPLPQGRERSESRCQANQAVKSKSDRRNCGVKGPGYGKPVFAGRRKKLPARYHYIRRHSLLPAVFLSPRGRYFALRCRSKRKRATAAPGNHRFTTELVAILRAFISSANRPKTRCGGRTPPPGLYGITFCEALTGSPLAGYPSFPRANLPALFTSTNFTPCIPLQSPRHSLIYASGARFMA